MKFAEYLFKLRYPGCWDMQPYYSMYTILSPVVFETLQSSSLKIMLYVSPSEVRRISHRRE